MHLVSVIVPIFNSKLFLSECIESVITQTYKNIELLLVDDGSNDGSIDICKKYSLKDSRVKVFFKKNGGQSSARNFGLEKAKGEYVFFLDSDDSITNTCLFDLVQFSVKFKTDIVSALDSRNQLDFGNEVLVYKGRKSVLEAISNRFLFQVEPWNKLIRRDLIVKNSLQFKEGLIYEDLPWTLTLGCIASSLVIVPRIMYTYRVVENSTMRSDRFVLFEKITPILREIANVRDQFKLQNQPSFRKWVEFHKALFFGRSRDSGINSKYLEQLYFEYRKVLPSPSIDKLGIHYYFPKKIGFVYYMKVYGEWFN